jgi:hypothetical protein
MEEKNPDEQGRQGGHAYKQNDSPSPGPGLMSRRLSLTMRFLKPSDPGHRGPRLGGDALHAILDDRIDRDQHVAHQALDLISPKAIWEVTGPAAFRAGVLDWHLRTSQHKTLPMPGRGIGDPFF